MVWSPNPNVGTRKQYGKLQAEGARILYQDRETILQAAKQERLAYEESPVRKKCNFCNFCTEFSAIC